MIGKKPPLEDDDDMGALDALMSAQPAEERSDDGAPPPAEEGSDEKDPAILVGQLRAKLDELEQMILKA